MGRSIGIVLGALASPGTGSGLCKIRFWIGQSEKHPRETDGVDRYGAIIDVDATR